MTAPAVMLVVLSIMTAGPSRSSDMASPTGSVARTVLSQAIMPTRDLAAADLAREPPAGSGVEFVRYASPPEFHNGLLVGGLYAWTGVLVGALMFLERRRLTSLLLGGGGVAIGIAMMLIG